MLSSTIENPISIIFYTSPVLHCLINNPSRHNIIGINNGQIGDQYAYYTARIFDEIRHNGPTQNWPYFHIGKIAAMQSIRLLCTQNSII